MLLQNMPAPVVKLKKYLWFRTKRGFLITLVYFVDKVLKIRIPPIASATAIISYKDKILVNKLSYKKGYGLPGGTLQKNENFETAAKREVEEETGLKVSSLVYFGSYWYNREFPSVNVTYLAQSKGNLRSSKEGKPMFVDPKDLLGKMAFPDNEMAIRDYIEWLKKPKS